MSLLVSHQKCSVTCKFDNFIANTWADKFDNPRIDGMPETAKHIMVMLFWCPLVKIMICP